jgi:hypothetical protein
MYDQFLTNLPVLALNKRCQEKEDLIAMWQILRFGTWQCGMWQKRGGFEEITIIIIIITNSNLVVTRWQ